jgi:lipoprotein-anchoring transpeptidase ErfK/SrfK
MNKPRNPYKQRQKSNPPPMLVRRQYVRPAVQGQAVKPMVRPRRRRLKEWSTTEIVAAAGIGGAALLVLGAIFLFSMFVLFTFSDVIMPGVMVGSTDLGGLNASRASEKLWTDWYQPRTLIITDGMNSWSDQPGQFGIYLDAQATADVAYQVGRGSDGLSEFINILFHKPYQVMPQVVLNEEIARSKLSLYQALIDEPARDAALQFVDGNWNASPGEFGRAIDVDSTLSNLSSQLPLVLSSGFLHLSIRPVPPQFEDVSGILQTLEPQLNQPMKFKAYDPITDEKFTWSVEPQTFGSWIRISNMAGEPELSISQESLQSYLDDWQVQLGPTRVLKADYDSEDLLQAWQNAKAYSLQIWHLPTTYTVQKGDMLTAVAYHEQMPYWQILDANPDIDPNNLITGQEIIIPSKNEMLPLPIVENKRIVISITEQHMWTYENGQLLDDYVISTGIDTSPTLPGIYQVQTHELNAYASVWDLYMPHFMGIYQGWPGFWNGIHGLPTLSSGVRLWESVLGRKASYGCVILTLQAAETVYNWAEDGVVVEIKP